MKAVYIDQSTTYLQNLMVESFDLKEAISIDIVSFTGFQWEL